MNRQRNRARQLAPRRNQLTGLICAAWSDSFSGYRIYVIAAAMALVGIFFAESMVLRQQDKVIASTANSAERVHAANNIIRFDEEGFTTYAAGDEQRFSYKDVKLVDMTDQAIYTWLSDTMIMPIPLHAFKNMSEMKEFNKWFKERVEQGGGKATQN